MLSSRTGVFALANAMVRDLLKCPRSIGRSIGPRVTEEVPHIASASADTPFGMTAKTQVLLIFCSFLAKFSNP